MTDSGGFMLESKPTETGSEIQVDGARIRDAQAIARRAAEIQLWLVLELARVVRVSPDQIDPQQPFVRYGLGSSQGFELAAKLEDWIGFLLPPTLVWDYPNIEALS